MSEGIYSGVKFIFYFSLPLGPTIVGQTSSPEKSALPMHLKTAFFFAFLSLFLNACVREEKEFYNGEGKKPVYLPVSELGDIGSRASEPIVESGTIFLRDTLLFILEQRKGIHVFNLKDSLNTVNMVFLKIPAITDFTLSDHYIYADTWRDLVTIDVADLFNIHETSRIRDVINPALYPLLYEGYFECVDESKGAIIGWENAVLDHAKCVTLN